ncbi:MAG: carbonic anhydrase [Deltaproteobacteria bacterium]|jgi:carbonic anhydrase|nr:carbonic anhydrase [Deltaproteobacteria bacterium]
MNPSQTNETGGFFEIAKAFSRSLAAITPALVLSCLLSWFPPFSAKPANADGGHPGQSSNPWTPDTALEALKAGNARFVSGKSVHPNSDKKLLETLASEGQFPLAAILSCSDSRVPVEEIFDLGFGDIFSIRVAGAVPGSDQLGSLEYSVEHLGTPLVVIMGHTRCGAVTAAIQGADEGGNLGELIEKLSPLASAVANIPETDRLNAAIKLSVARFGEEIPSLSPPIDEAVKSGKLRLVTAICDIDTGLVTFGE